MQFLEKIYPESFLMYLIRVAFLGTIFRYFNKYILMENVKIDPLYFSSHMIFTIGTIIIVTNKFFKDDCKEKSLFPTITEDLFILGFFLINILYNPVTQ